MELHFSDEKQKMQCYEMWKNSQDYDDLFAYQACTKHALNISSTLFVNGTIRLLRKLTPGWVRDGWLTETQWSPKDFMFHGWKKSKLGEEWEWPFAYHFHISECIYRDPYFSNFKYIPKFVSTNFRIKNLLTQKVKEIEVVYNTTLISRRIICRNGLKPINGICLQNRRQKNILRGPRIQNAIL
uniref:Uncharacterized protein n=1 Tax=Panagrolaimus superbus TaxID=310955 RepID=A0A914ZCS7_9BILA